MGSWDDYRLFCRHGIREGLDSHDCPQCAELCKKAKHPERDANGMSHSCIWLDEEKK